MYIPYEKIGKIVCSALPKKLEKIVEKLFLELKTSSNCRYIKKNSKNVLKNLREKKERPFRVAFLCDDGTKWKCQSLFELFRLSRYFEPFILVTKNDAPKNSSKPTDVNDVLAAYDFFNKKCLKTFLAYDVVNNKFIPIENFRPDIIFYQQPWYVHTQQGPVVASKFALTFYVPYFVANVSSEMEYNLRFHRYIYRHYLLNNLVKDFYSHKMKNKGNNLKVVGHPQLDYFLNAEKPQKSMDYVIYAPHWSINYPQENYATFEWNGREILDYAKKHTDLNWVFKPHPLLKHRLVTQNVMTTEEVEKYWKDWGEIATVYEKGDYMHLFSHSKAMITDCGSFLTEFLLTEKPVIRLASKNAVPYNPSAQKIVESYYCANNLDEMFNLFEDVLIKDFDPMLQKRLEVIEELGLRGNFAAKNILYDIEEELGIR